MQPHHALKPPRPLFNTNVADYVDAVTTSFTEEGVVVVLDLHWNLREKTQTSYALDVNTIQFWEGVAERYADNDLVFYELYVRFQRPRPHSRPR